MGKVDWIDNIPSLEMFGCVALLEANICNMEKLFKDWQYKKVFCSSESHNNFNVNSMVYVRVCFSF